MGSALASVLVSQGLVVIGASEGRSPASRARAAEAGMQDRGSLAAVATEAEVIVSVCPPGRAEELAQLVEQAGFGGLYVDANAVAPATARRIAQRFPRFADGGIIGPPPWLAGTTRLYVSGPEAALVAQLFASGPLDVRLVEGEPGAASAVKVCYAAWTKGTSAVLLSIRALAVAEGVTGP